MSSNEQKLDGFTQLAQVIRDGGNRATTFGAFMIGTITALVPLTVSVGEQIYMDGEVLLCRQLTDREERVTVDWRTEVASDHTHAILGEKVITIASPLAVGQRLLLLPTADEQSVYAVDIL